MDLDESLPENEASMDTVLPSRADAIYLNLEPDEVGDGATTLLAL